MKSQKRMKTKRKAPVLPFCLAGHRWTYVEWAKKCGDDVIAVCPPLALVRDSDEGELHWRMSESRTPDVATDTRLGLTTLLDRAEAGDEEAGYRAGVLIGTYCARLNQVARLRPKLFRRAARSSWQWPVLVSLHPYLCEDFKPLLNSLELGQDTPLEVHPSARWVNDKAANIAFGLMAYLLQIRGGRRDKRSLCDQGVTRAISKLQEFSSDTAEAWWEQAKGALLAVYPEPQNIAELAELVKAPTKRKSPGRMRGYILEMLHDRFVSFAPPPATYRT